MKSRFVRQCFLVPGLTVGSRFSFSVIIFSQTHAVCTGGGLLAAKPWVPSARAAKKEESLTQSLLSYLNDKLSSV